MCISHLGGTPYPILAHRSRDDPFEGLLVVLGMQVAFPAGAVEMDVRLDWNKSRETALNRGTARVRTGNQGIMSPLLYR